MIKEADEFASEDEAQHCRIEALNSLALYIYNVKGQLRDAKVRERADHNSRSARGEVERGSGSRKPNHSDAL